MRDDEVVFTYMKSPAGNILLARTEAGLTHLNFQEGAKPLTPGPAWRKENSPLLDAVDQLRAYFYGELQSFDLPLAPHGTPFQQRVWEALQRIPCGETLAYSDIARQIGEPQAVRAVGSANGRNPLPIVIPCHRVIGKDGRLTGYGGGIKIKRLLLELEEKKVRTLGKQLSLTA